MAAGGKTFTATRRPSETCSASKTTPIPPRPISRKSRKSPRVSWASSKRGGACTSVASSNSEGGWNAGRGSRNRCRTAPIPVRVGTEHSLGLKFHREAVVNHRAHHDVWLL